MTQKHTPLPWRTYKNFCESDGRLIGVGCSGSDIAKVHTSQDIPTRHDREALANAEFITRACNSYYALLAILEDYCRAFETNGNHDTYVRAMVALKKAKGE
jgi:hypothetical protein